MAAPVVDPTFRVPSGPFPYVPRLPIPGDTPRTELDRAVAELRANADGWVAMSPAARVRLLDEVVAATAEVADRWIELGALHEGVDPGGRDAAEEGIVGPYLFLRGLRLHRGALRDIERYGRPRLPGPVRAMGDGRAAVRVMPADPADRLLYLGVSGEVRMLPGVTPEALPGTMAAAYRTPPPGRVCLVLGAGNASSIGPLDIIHKLFVEQQVVVCKSHPVMAHLADVLDAALAPLVRAGVLRLVHGAADVGGYLVHHPGVDTLHITGADRTYDAIVFGPGPEGEARKARDAPLVTKPFTAELGNLTPIIVVPGRWTAAELDYHAENIATMLTNNAGFNCTTSRVIVTAKQWPQRAALLDRVRARLTAIPTRLAFYPGARERWMAFSEAHPEAERIGTAAEGHLPWMLIPDLSPDAVDDPCYRVEAFCSVTAETAIDAPDLSAYLDQAIRFANETLWGSLNATVIADPRTRRDAGDGQAVERALDGLRYGAVSLNHWSALGYGLGITPWGAYPGNTRQDIGSGTGFVHNPLMFGAVEKTVMRAPFRAWPKPPWFSNHGRALPLVRHLVAYEAGRNPARLLPLAVDALRG